MDTEIRQGLKQIIDQSLGRSMSASDYNDLLQSFAKEGKTTGHKQNEDLIHYTKLNAHRGKRIFKTWELNDELTDKIRSIETPQNWVLITESWCGDAANSVPIITQLAELNEKINLRIVLRDENDELMNEFLTNGGRSIPKLIALSDEFEVQFTWGPRPVEAQALYSNWRNSDDRIPYSEFHIVLQKWYNDDAGHAMQEELMELISG